MGVAVGIAIHPYCFLVELVHVWHVQILYIIKGLPLRQSLACNKFKFYDFYLAA